MYNKSFKHFFAYVTLYQIILKACSWLSRSAIYFLMKCDT